MTDKPADADSGVDSTQGGAPSPFDQVTEAIPTAGGARVRHEWDPPAGAAQTTGSRWSRLGHPVQTARFTPGARAPQPGGAGPTVEGPTVAGPTYSEVLDEDDLAFGGAAAEPSPHLRRGPAPAAAEAPPAAADTRTEVLAVPTAEVPPGAFSQVAGDAAQRTDPLPSVAEPPSAGAPTAAFAPVQVHKGPAYGAPQDSVEDTAWAYAPQYEPTPAPSYQPAYQPAPEPRPAPAQAPPPQGRGTLDVGLLVLRVLVGGLLVVDGLRNTLGFAGGPGLSGLEALVVSWGFEYGRAVAIGLVSVQLGAGVLIVVGLATPLAAAVVVAAMLNVTLGQHLGGGPVLLFSPGVDELPLVTGVAAAALALTGPGRASLDAPMRWSTRPRFGSFALLVLGAVAGVAGWLVLTGTVGG